MREEMEEGQRALLQRLFPDITVEDTSSSAAWTNQFEAKTQLSIEDSKKQVYNIVYVCIYFRPKLS